MPPSHLARSSPPLPPLLPLLLSCSRAPPPAPLLLSSPSYSLPTPCVAASLPSPPHPDPSIPLPLLSSPCSPLTPSSALGLGVADYFEGNSSCHGADILRGDELSAAEVDSVLAAFPS
mmetsp:Transcript_18875/g.61954  ORF Transcript_18875/g.61954 Transcript_18875/m.61954 type:complete len:118 (+) Transcript_18875:1994-2347(+)